jgi:hypothetical protein
MKKIKFSGLNFGSAEALSKIEQKKVLGGFGYGDWNNEGGGATKCDQKSCSWRVGTDTTATYRTGVCTVSGTGTPSNPCFYVCPGSGTCY